MSIVVQGVTKLYGSQKALDNVSFEVKTGEIVGFLGPNGAGKSTMMKIIAGFIPASSGRVDVNGVAVDSDNNDVKKQIGYLPENNPLYPEMYIREYLGFVASIYKSSIPRKKQIDNIIELTGLSSEQNKKIGSLSKGFRQRVGLAQALIHNPDLIILDEPTTGLDPQGMKEVRDLILFLSKQDKKTIFISSHILYEIELVANRMIIIDKGSAIVEGNVSELLNANNLKVTFEVNDSDRTKSILNNTSWINKIESSAHNKIIFSLTIDEIPKLNSYLVENKIEVSAMIPARSLEQYFLNITEKGV